MNSAEIVESEVQRKGCVMVFPFLRMAIRQPRHPANLHSDVEVLPFGVTRASLFEVGRTDAGSGVAIYYFPR